ncbi:hypothetical protein [Actinomadura sp. B10D3]|uniref:hypothetical protein n=1 Tax=Actinomadura sp. B10D3 TaxID=3153557 RepID=UPI00325DA2C4
MTPRTAKALRSAGCVVAAAALATGCSGGGGGPDARPTGRTTETTTSLPSAVPPTTAPSPPPDDLPTPVRIDDGNATALSQGALTIMYTVDSTVDAGLRDAKLRAAGYFTDEYTAVVQAEVRQYVPTEWHKHRAYLAVRLRPLYKEQGAPTDGPTAAFRQWEMVTRPTGRDGWRGAPSRSVVYMELTRPSPRAPWRISSVSVSADG